MTSNARVRLLAATSSIVLVGALFTAAIQTRAAAERDRAASMVLDRHGLPLDGRVVEQLGLANGTTTIDRPLQRDAERALDAAMDRANADDAAQLGRGTAILMDLRAGSVVAVASDTDVPGTLATRALPPGSVVKPFVAFASLGSGVVDGTSAYPCPRAYTYGDRFISHNWKSKDQPPMTVARALGESCNSVFYEMAVRMWKRGDTGIENTFRSFGFGAPSGVVPSEEAGIAPARAETLPELVALSIGQGSLRVTPLQVARAYAALALGGRVRSHDVTGREERRIERPIEAEALGVVRAGIEGVPIEGTAANAFEGSSMSVAGKTGTADVGEGAPASWFVAYAPAHAPRYVAVAVVERGGHGATIAAPIVRDLLERTAAEDPDAFTAPIPMRRDTRIAVALVLAIMLGLISPAAGALGGAAAGLVIDGMTTFPAGPGLLALAAAGWVAGMIRRRYGPPAAIVSATALATLILAGVRQLFSGALPIADETHRIALSVMFVPALAVAAAAARLWSIRR